MLPGTPTPDAPYGVRLKAPQQAKPYRGPVQGTVTVQNGELDDFGCCARTVADYMLAWFRRPNGHHPIIAATTLNKRSANSHNPGDGCRNPSTAVPQSLG